MVQTIQTYGISGEDSDASKIVPTFSSGDDLVVMVNNLGGTSNFELSILANSVVKLLEGSTMGKCIVSRLYVGSFMTSFDMHGASVSILSLSNVPEIKELLDFDTDAPAWISADVWNVSKEGEVRPSQIEYPEIQGSSSDKQETFDNVKLIIPNFSDCLIKSVKAACQVLIDSEPLLTKYDTIVGDGDCGLTMERGAKEVLSQLESKMLRTYHPVPFFDSLACAISKSMGGMYLNERCKKDYVC